LGPSQIADDGLIGIVAVDPGKAFWLKIEFVQRFCALIQMPQVARQLLYPFVPIDV
jgi:hypothetical protein